MNDTPNTQHWQAGQLVIHDADTKCEEMLMKVIGYARDGQVKTRYVHPRRYLGMGDVFKNELAYLHDPARFGLEKEQVSA